MLKFAIYSIPWAKIKAITTEGAAVYVVVDGTGEKMKVRECITTEQALELVHGLEGLREAANGGGVMIEVIIDDL